jgi:malate synthase
LTSRQDQKTDKKIENNTKLAAEYMKQIIDGGLALKGVEVAR